MFKNRDLLKKVALLSIVPLLFVIVSIFTLKDYGISWDEPIHFYRGQAYLHYFLTGKTTYEQTRVGSMSYFELNDLSAEYFLDGGDGGHPPLNDILAALSNYVFYQKLHLVGDIDSYHIFNFSAALLTIISVSVFGYIALGTLGGISAALVVATYPLFWGESHFNIKDPPETGFISMAILLFYLSLKKGSWKWLIASSIFSGLALGTKFNAFFIPIILIPFLISKYLPFIKRGVKKISQEVRKIPKSFVLAMLFYPLIVLAIFVITWPFLWGDPIGNFMKVFDYYKDIGTGSSYQPGYYLPGGFNAYPLIWIIITTPPIVLILATIGTLISLKRIIKGENRDIHVLFLSWLLIPIVRVTWPESSIYGGVRQIMEYIPALGLISAVGFTSIANKLKANLVNATLILILIFASHFYVLVHLHPNENVYFNSLIGGIKGAVSSNIPYAGNSFGNAYWPLLKWLNQNAEPNARVALVQGTALNIPDIQLRPDITRWSDFWSGINRNGEYLIELTHNNYRIAYPYAWDYIERFLVPVATVNVDGVDIAKLWKNDIDHTKPDMKIFEYENTDFKIEIKKPDINITLSKAQALSHVVISFKYSKTCGKLTGNFYTSIDNKKWDTAPEGVPDLQISEKDMVKDGVLSYYFAGTTAKYIRFHETSLDSCIFENTKAKVFSLKK